MKIDERLKEWATEKQAQYIDAVNEHGGFRAAARALGLNKTTLQISIQRLQNNAATRGYSPEHGWNNTVPTTHIAKGVSTYYDADGNVKGQWVKADLDKKKALELVQQAIQVMAQEIKGLSPLISAPNKTNSDLLAVYPMGDPHIGMYAWAKECGEDFNLDDARRITFGAIDRLVTAAPAADTCVILPLGDVFHADDQSNVTPGHGHQLDVDTRYVKVLEVGIETFRHVIVRALEKHKNVVVRFVQGNHDPNSVWALAFTIHAYFANNPRVTVDLTPAKSWFYRFGRVLIGATHGDTIKPENLLGVMACDRAQDWGETKHRYFYSGHIHHRQVKEYPGMIWESFRTLAAKDAYAAGHGYRAGRDMMCIIHHKDHGEIERHTCDIGML